MDFASLSPMELANTLSGEFGQDVANVIEESQLDGRVFVSMTREDFAELFPGATHFLLRKKLLQYVKNTRSSARAGLATPNFKEEEQLVISPFVPNVQNELRLETSSTTSSTISAEWDVCSIKQEDMKEDSDIEEILMNQEPLSASGHHGDVDGHVVMVAPLEEEQQPPTKESEHSKSADKLEQIFTMLESIDQRLYNIEEMHRAQLEREQLKEHQQQQQQPGSHTGRKRQDAKVIEVSNDVKNLVHLGYKSGTKKGLKWTFAPGARYNDEKNIAMTMHITFYAKMAAKDEPVNPRELSRATQTYFRTKMTNNGRNMKEHREKVSSYSRRTQKAKRRLRACAETELYDENPEKKLRVSQALRPEYMSSEEEDNGTMIVHHLPWEDEEFTRAKQDCDTVYRDSVANMQSRRQMLPRKQGTESKRQPPKVPQAQVWIVRSEFRRKLLSKKGVDS